jgi:hypothetical protein
MALSDEALTAARAAGAAAHTKPDRQRTPDFFDSLGREVLTSAILGLASFTTAFA